MVKKGHAWLVREKNGTPVLYFNQKPIRGKEGWSQLYHVDRTEITEDMIPKGINPDWKNPTPIEIEISINIINK